MRNDTRVLRSRVGHMPMAAEAALASALLARRLRLVLRGAGGMGCRPMGPGVEAQGRATLGAIAGHVRLLRERVRAYRRGRSWERSGAGR